MGRTGMIRRIQIENFKSLADVTVDLGPFTVLIGKNGAGKSAFLQALEVLSWLIRHKSINETFDREGVTFSELVSLKAQTKRIVWRCEVDVSLSGRAASAQLDYVVSIGKRRHVHVGVELAKLVEDRGASLAELMGTGRPCLGRRSSQIAIAEEGENRLKYEGAVIAHSLLQEVWDQTFLFGEEFPILGALAAELAGFRHFQIWGPESLRLNSKGKAGLLGEKGQDLPSVIAELKARRDEHGSYRQLLKEMQTVYPWLDEIEVRHLPGGDFGLSFVERAGETNKKRLKYSPAQVSDGFLRLLALTTLKYQTDSVPVLGYEEPENGLHPQVLEESVRRLRDIAKSGTQVIVTTHSPYLLDYLMEAEDDDLQPELRVVVRGDDGATKILPADKERLAEAKAQGIGAGELWTLLVDELQLVGGNSR